MGNCTALHGAKTINVRCVGNKTPKYTVYSKVKDGKT